MAAHDADRYQFGGVAGGVGASPLRHDAHGKVTGEATFPADRVPGDALHMLVVFTNRPHARLLSLDTTAAEAASGVVAIVTADDVPLNEYGLTMFDQPVLIGAENSTNSTVDCTISRWEADHLALVIAETAEQATAAAAMIEAVWEDLPVVDNIDDALTDDVLVHADVGDSNLYHTLKVRKGDPEKAFAEADVIIEGTYEVPHQEHAFLQTEAGTAWVDGEGVITVETSGQWTWEDQQQIAHALALPDDQVRVIYAAIGGAFGGKEDMSLQIVLALAAKKLHDLDVKRPVHAIWNREQSIVGHHKRHRARITHRLGARSDGKIVAVEATVWLDAGAYNYTSTKVLGNAHLSVAGAYEVPNAKIDSHTVYTHSVPGGAFRGFGGPQGAFAAETQMNKLAAALNIDPVEIRRINTLRDGVDGITQEPLPIGVTLPEVLEACAEATEVPIDHKPFRPIASLPPSASIKRGRGFAMGFKNVGFSFGFPERCEAEIRLFPAPEIDTAEDNPYSAELYHGGADVGQGAHLAFRQMAAEATGIPLERVVGHFSDTSTTGDSGSASASRLTWMAGNSILAAAADAEKAWRDGDRPAVGKVRFTPPATEQLDEETGKGQPNFTYGYMAQSIDVTVDVETGHIRVDRVVSAHDVGRAINPELLKGQIEGAIVQAHGYALSERLVIQDGRIVNPRFSSYLIPGIGDVPLEVVPVILELADPLGPWGARGVAEMPYITYAPALIAAVAEATGVWFDEFPLTPSRVLAGLAAAQH